MGRHSAYDDANGHGIARRLLPVLLRPAAEIAAHQDIAAHRQADGQLRQHVHDDTGGIDGGDTIVSNKVAGNDDICNAVNGLQKTGGHQRHGIPDQLTADAALGQVVLKSGHSHPLLFSVSYRV